MVNLDVQFWELGTQRLHQGLSETILVNTLTDVREFKNSPLGLKQKSTCIFWESGNPSIANNIFIDTRSIKIIITTPPTTQPVEGPIKYTFSHCAMLAKARLMINI